MTGTTGSDSENKLSSIVLKSYFHPGSDGSNFFCLNVWRWWYRSEGNSIRSFSGTNIAALDHR